MIRFLFRRRQPATRDDLVEVVHQLIGEIRLLQDDFVQTPGMARAFDVLTRYRPAAEQPPRSCTVPPPGWYCTRVAGHDGPCAAWPVPTSGDPS